MATRRGPFLSVRLLWPFLAAIRSHEVDVGALLARAGLAWGVVLDREARIAHDAALELLALARAATGSETLGLEAAHWNLAMEFDLIEFAAATSRDHLDAASVFREHGKLLHQAVDLGIDVEGDYVVCRYRWLGGIEVPREMIDFALATTVLNFQRFGAITPRIAGAELTCPPPSNLAPYRALFGDAIAFGTARNAVVFHREGYDAPPPGRNPELHSVLRRTLERLSKGVRSPARLADRVAEALTGSLGKEPPTVRAVAKKLGMSESSLRSHLREEGNGFSEILDAVREALATRYLDETELGAAEIADALGFSHANAFLRAFKRWTGQTPKQFRARAVRTGR